MPSNCRLSAGGGPERIAALGRLRFERLGESGLFDRSSRPHKTRSTIELAQRIEQLRRARMPMRRIATVLGRSLACISRFLAARRLSSLTAL